VEVLLGFVFSSSILGMDVMGGFGPSDASSNLARATNSVYHKGDFSVFFCRKGWFYPRARGRTRRAILAVLAEWKADDLQGDLGGDWFQPDTARDLIKFLSDKYMNYEAEYGFHVRALGTQT
jgi:hypothetical protein